VSHRADPRRVYHTTPTLAETVVKQNRCIIYWRESSIKGIERGVVMMVIRRHPVRKASVEHSKGGEDLKAETLTVTVYHDRDLAVA